MRPPLILEIFFSQENSVYVYIIVRWCRIGTEHEKFGFEVSTLRPMKYEQIAALLNGIAERFEWDKIMEGNNIIGLKQVNYRTPFLVDFFLI